MYFAYCFSCRYLVELGLRQLGLPAPKKNILANYLCIGFVSGGSAKSFHVGDGCSVSYEVMTVRMRRQNKKKSYRHERRTMKEEAEAEGEAKKTWQTGAE